MSMISFRFLNGASCCIWHGAKKKSSWYQCSCCLRSMAGNIRKIVKSHVLDSKASGFKTFQVTMCFSNIPWCLPLTLLHVVQMRWLDHFLIQTSPSSQHNSPLLGITSAVYIFPPMLMEIWRGPRDTPKEPRINETVLVKFPKTNTSPPTKKKTEPPKNSIDSMFFEVSEKKHITTVVRGFQFFMIGDSSIPTGENLAISTEFHNPRVPPSSLQPPKVRKDPNENLEPRWERWTEGVPRAAVSVAGQLGEAFRKTLPPRITDLWSGGFLENLWGVTWKLQPSSHNLGGVSPMKYSFLSF